MKLEALATKIKAEHQQVVGTVRKSLEHARKAGELLAKAKEQVVKDSTFKWSRWVEKECGIQERTASNYIRLFKNWSKLAKAGDPSTLTVRAALVMLKKRQRKPKPAEQRRSSPYRYTLTDLERLMQKHGIDGAPDKLAALLEEMGVKLPIAQGEPVTAGAQVG